MKAVLPPQPNPPPALSAEHVTTLQSSQPGASPQQVAAKLTRSSDGKMRIDTARASVITNPAAGHAIMLDHVKKEARVVPLPPAGPAPPAAPHGAPGGPPAAPAAPSLPGMSVKDLGKRMVEGHELEGKQYTLPPATPPKPPTGTQAPAGPKPPAAPGLKVPGLSGLPGVPGVPKAPGVPGAPQPAAVSGPKAPGAPSAPQAPKLPPPPTVTEMWSSQKLHLPVLTRVTGSFGKQTSHSKNVSGGEPAASLFQIPAGYKQIGPPKH